MVECRSYRLSGVVVSGVGKGSYYVELYRDAFRRALGLDPYPGTLNIDLGFDAGFIWRTLDSITVYPPNSGLGIVYALPAMIDSIRGYIVRSEKTIHGWNIIEFISDVHVRSRLGLRDGDSIKVIVYDRKCMCLYREI